MTAIFKELDNTDQKWEYAKLAELASEHGGPEQLIEDIYSDGFEDGFNAGCIQGNEEGYKEGYEVGYEDGALAVLSQIENSSQVDDTNNAQQDDMLNKVAMLSAGAAIGGVIVGLGKLAWNKYKTHKELKAVEKNEIETIKETSAKDYAENLLNEADKDDEIVTAIIDEDGSIITVDFS
jgi:flagellar biosynthesis/type III secretory pathway protein FliH